jgi:SAM-dependent methyltransferase
MSEGWDQSAKAWIASMGERGDWAREHILDPAMFARIDLQPFRCALDVGCGEGRFCRMLKARGISSIGVDASRPLLEAAIDRDPSGGYCLARAERLPLDDDSFDLVVSYITLCDISDFRAAISEMARVLAAGGTLLIANLTSMNTANPGALWVTDDDGERIHWPVDRYLDEFSMRSEWRGISVVNWHRPLSAYMSALLDAGLRLIFFDEPEPCSDDPERRERYRRMPWFVVMEWRATKRS